MDNSEKKVFSSDYFSEEVLQQGESLTDIIKRAHEEATKRGIEANTIMIDNKLAYVKGFDFMETCRGGFHYVRQYPPMILGMEVFTGDLSREFPPGTGFVVTHRDATTIDRIREEAKEELIKELKEMSLRDLLFKLYNDEIEDY